MRSGCAELCETVTQTRNCKILTEEQNTSAQRAAELQISMQTEPIKESLTNPRSVRAPARAPRWTVPMVKTLLAVTDIALALLSFVLAFYLRHGESIVHRAARGNLDWSGAFAPYALLLPL